MSSKLWYTSTSPYRRRTIWERSPCATTISDWSPNSSYADIPPVHHITISTELIFRMRWATLLSTAGYLQQQSNTASPQSLLATDNFFVATQLYRYKASNSACVMWQTSGKVEIVMFASARRSKLGTQWFPARYASLKYEQFIKSANSWFHTICTKVTSSKAS